LEPGGENKSAAHAGGRLSPARSPPVSPPIKGWDRTSTPSTPSMMPHKPISGARRMPAGRRSGPNMTMAASAAVSVLTRQHHSMFCAAEGRAMTMRAALLLAAILAPTDALAGDAWPDSPNKLWFENLQRPDNHKRPYKDKYMRSCCGPGDDRWMALRSSRTFLVICMARVKLGRRCRNLPSPAVRGRQTAETLRPPRNLFTTRVASASPSTSSAMMRGGLPACTTASRSGSSSLRAESFFLWSTDALTSR